MQRERVGVTLYHYCLLLRSDGLFCLKERIQYLAFVIDKRLRGIDIFCLTVVLHLPRAEADDASGYIMNGKHCPPSKPIVGFAARFVFFENQSRVIHRRLRKAEFGECSEGRRERIRRETEREIINQFFSKSPFGKVLERGFAFGFCEGCVVELRSRSERFISRIDAVVAAVIGFVFVRKDDTGFRSKGFDGFDKSEPMEVGHEGEHITAFAAGEAFENLQIGADIHRRLAIRVERAESDEAATGLFERDGFSDNFNNIRALPYLVDDVFGYLHEAIKVDMRVCQAIQQPAKLSKKEMKVRVFALRKYATDDESVCISLVSIWLPFLCNSL